MTMARDVRQDLLDEFAAKVTELAGEYRRKLAAQAPPAGSQTVAFALAAGLPARMAYSVSEVARITGVPVQTLYEEHEAGRIAFVTPKTRERGFRVKAREVDRWMEENSG